MMPSLDLRVAAGDRADYGVRARCLLDMLMDLGYHEIQSAIGVPEALPLAETAELAFAILDANLGEQHAFPVADRLRARGIDGEYVGSVVLRKPFRRDELATATNWRLAASA